MTLEADSCSSEDLRTKCRRALKSIIGKLTHLPALDALVQRNLPEGVMKMVLEQVHAFCCFGSCLRDLSFILLLIKTQLVAGYACFLNLATSILTYHFIHHVLTQVGKVLGNDPSGRAAFVHSGGLAAVQQMAEAPGSKLKEAVEIINSAYPEEVRAWFVCVCEHLLFKDCLQTCCVIMCALFSLPSVLLLV